MTWVFLCDRCSKLLSANRIAPLCASCKSHTHDWARPLTVAEIETAARRAYLSRDVQRPARRRR